MWDASVWRETGNKSISSRPEELSFHLLPLPLPPLPLNYGTVGPTYNNRQVAFVIVFFSVFSLSSLPFSLPVLYSSYALLYNVITGPKNVTIFCAPFSTLSSSRYFVFFLSLFLNKHKSINRIKGWKLKGLKKRSNTKLSQRCRKLVVRRQKYVEREKVAAHAAPLTVSGRVSFRSAAMQRA